MFKSPNIFISISAGSDWKDGGCGSSAARISRDANESPGADGIGHGGDMLRVLLGKVFLELERTVA